MENKANNQNQSQEGANKILGNASSYLKNIDFNKVPEQLKQFGATAANKVKGLSTTQKVIGGALLLWGANYLSKRSKMDFRNLTHSSRSKD